MESEEEEEVDDDEDAAIRQAEGCEINNKSNGLNHETVGNTVSNVVEDMVEKIEDKELNNGRRRKNESLAELLQRELKQAVKDLIAQQVDFEEDSFESQLKACLCNQIKVSLANIHEDSRKVDNPTELFMNVMHLGMVSNKIFIKITK